MPFRFIVILFGMFSERGSDCSNCRRIGVAQPQRFHGSGSGSGFGFRSFQVKNTTISIPVQYSLVKRTVFTYHLCKGSHKK